VAYTKIIPEANIELTGIWDMEFDTEDPATRYQNGILSDLEVLAIKRFKCGLGIGFIESWIQQVNDDGGAPAVLNGFVGRAFGIGRSLPTPRRLVRAILILARAGFTTSMSPSASRVTGSTLARA
jgi:hypothetical protein